jgi:L-methionine (R)-S-oxide reductase
MTKEQFYAELKRDLCALLDGETNFIAALSNASALINERLDDVNWAGFYLMDGAQLVLGPFQGKIACVRIPVGKGVCGTAVAETACNVLVMSMLSQAISPVTQPVMQKLCCR